MAKKRSGAPCYWPGPTRLYDRRVDCGAVLLTGELARSLMNAAAECLNTGSLSADSHERRWLKTAYDVLAFTFGEDTRHVP